MTNKTEEFQSKFFGKVPAFESGATALCDDTAIAHFVGNQQTRGGEKTEEVKKSNFNPSAAGCTKNCANRFCARFRLTSQNFKNLSTGPKSIIFYALSAPMIKISEK